MAPSRGWAPMILRPMPPWASPRGASHEPAVVPLSRLAMVALGEESRGGDPAANAAPRAVGHLAVLAVVFVAYVVAGKLGQATTEIRSSNLGPVWPAYGVALAAVLLCGYRVWPGIV